MPIFPADMEQHRAWLEKRDASETQQRKNAELRKRAERAMLERDQEAFQRLADEASVSDGLTIFVCGCNQGAK